jgi:adenine-specific DNA-methyltransferase
LRLWIELLKNAYYNDDGKLETLPNIDINIQAGNSLISRFSLDADLKSALKRSNVNVENYKKAFHSYQNAKSKPEKKEMEQLIKSIKENFYAEAYENDLNKKLLTQKISAKYALSNASLIEETEKEKIAKDKALQKIENEITRLSSEIENFRNNPLYKNAFEWRFEFPEALNDDGDFVGFDVVIGNPPYIKEYTNKSAFDVIRTQAYYQGKMDLWYFFACLSIDLVKEKTGILNFIATNNWTTNSGASKLRNKIIKDTKFKQLIDFSSYMIFESADIQTMIMMVINDNSQNNYQLDYRKIKSEQVSPNDIQDILNNIKTENNEFLQPIITKDDFLDKTITFSSTQNEIILEKMQQQRNFIFNEDEVANGIHPHHDYVNKKMQEILGDNFHVGQGIFVLSEDEKKNLNLNKKELQLLKPYYTTKQLSRWFGNPKNSEWIIYTGSEFKEPERMKPYPNLKKHLDQLQNVITSENKPYGLNRPRKEILFKGEKIIALRKCVGMPIFTYTDFDCYVSATFYVVKTDRVNQKYLTAFLNSKLIAFWLKNKGKMQGNNYQLDKEPLLNIPIYNANELEQEPIIKLVDKILTAKKSGKETHDLELQIDTLVYELYDLTADEIKIIEGNL